MGREWTAKWIGLEEGDSFHPVIFKDFYLDDPVQKATLYIASAGLFEVYVNGQRVGEERLTPYRYHAKTGVPYFAFPVTALLHSGPDSEANTVDIFLGKGLEDPAFTDRYALRAEFVIEVEKRRRVGFSEETDTEDVLTDEELEAELDELSEDPSFWESVETEAYPAEEGAEVLLLAMKGSRRSKKAPAFELKDLDELDDFLKNVIGDDKPNLDPVPELGEEETFDEAWLPKPEDVIAEKEEPESVAPQRAERERPLFFEIGETKKQGAEESPEEEPAEAESEAVLEEAVEAVEPATEAESVPDAEEELDLDIFDFEDWDELGIRPQKKERSEISELHVTPYRITDDALDELFETSIDPMIQAQEEDEKPEFVPLEDVEFEEEPEEASEPEESLEDVSEDNIEEPEEAEEIEEVTVEEPEEIEEIIEEPEEEIEEPVVEETVTAAEEIVEEPEEETEEVETSEEEVEEVIAEEPEGTEVEDSEEAVEEVIVEPKEVAEEAPAEPVEIEEIYETTLETIVIGTDETWGYYASDLSMNDLEKGEVFDRLLWEHAENPEKSVTVLELDVPLTERRALPVYAQEFLPVQTIYYPPDGSAVLDFGQRFTGFVSFDSSLEKGAQVSLTFAEGIAEDGTAENEAGTFTYVSDGEPEAVAPHFSCFTGRYVKTTGFGDALNPSDFTGCVMYADIEQTGFLDTSDDAMNQKAEDLLRNQKSASVLAPAERNAENDVLFTPAAAYNMNLNAFLAEYLNEQAASETITQADTAPLIWNLYRMYGDEALLEEQYEQMKAWTDRVQEKDAEGGDPQYLYTFGVEEEDVFAASADYFQNVRLVSLAAKELGKEQDAFRYEKLSRKIKQAILEEFFTISGRFALDTQSDYIRALENGLYVDKKKTTDAFLRRMEKDGWKRNCRNGETADLLRILEEIGRMDEAYVLMEEEDAAETVRFLYEQAAGIRPTEPGFARAEIAPLPNGRLSHCAATYQSVRGTLVSNWTITPEGALTFHLEVPEGMTCRIVLPYYPVCAANGNEMTVNGGSFDYTYMPSVKLLPKKAGE